MSYKDIRINDEWHDIISCDKCGDEIGVFGQYEDTKHIEGLNHLVGGKSDHECSGCKGSRHTRYDAYVDPLGAYH